MKTPRSRWLQWSSLLLVLLGGDAAWAASAGSPALEIGLGVRDITPELPIRLAGYAARKKGAEKIDTPLYVQALALRNSSGERFVFVALDNCEVSGAFNAPWVADAQQKYGLKRGEVMVVSSHTHSAPVLEETLVTMYQMSEAERGQIAKYSQLLRSNVVQVIGMALADLKPAQLEYGAGRAAFAMNRRVFREDKVQIGENPEGPVDWDVPVLKIKGSNDTVRAIVFGYACHGTSISFSNDFYAVSGDYIAYARQHLETVYPGTVALFLTGMGADCNPAPRSRLLHSKRHGLELAGAVTSVLDHPMRPVRGEFKLAYDEVELPFMEPPTREQLEKDAQDKDIYIRERAEAFKKMLAEGKALPASIKLPMAALRIGDDLTFIVMAGEVVVDYAKQFKRLFAGEHPWTIGYAYEVPCYIPSARVLKEGGYEADSSLIYYGFYGPFRPSIEQTVVSRMTGLVGSLRKD